MKNKSILYRFGLVVLVVLLLVLILPSSKIDLASKTFSASTQASVRAENTSRILPAPTKWSSRCYSMFG